MEVRNTATNALLWHREAGTVAISQTGTVVKEFLGSAAQPGVRNYDALGRLTATASAGNAPLNLAFEYDTIGNVTKRTDSYNGVTESLAYDSRNRLMSASGTNLITRSFDYDAIGNITYKSDAGLYAYGAAGCGGPHAVTSIAGTVNASYCYDANGNLLSGAGRTIGYSTFNLPMQISQGSDIFQYVYDVNHQRAKLVVTRDGYLHHHLPAPRGRRATPLRKGNEGGRLGRAATLHQCPGSDRCVRYGHAGRERDALLPLRPDRFDRGGHQRRRRLAPRVGVRSLWQTPIPGRNARPLQRDPRNGDRQRVYRSRAPRRDRAHPHERASLRSAARALHDRRPHSAERGEPPDL